MPTFFSAARTRLALTVVLVGGLLCGWLWLTHHTFGYLGNVFSQPDFRINQIVLLAVLGLAIWQTRQVRWDAALWQIGANGWAAGLFGLCCLGYVWAERTLAINTLSATLLGLGCYAWSGLLLSPARWRANLPLALLALFTLPFGDHLQTFAGYPLRIVTAQQVQHVLNALHVSNSSLETILVLENGISQVDVPCSGIKSLWTGLLLLLAVTWLEQARLNWRWLLLACGFACLLLVANFWRVLLLVLVGQVLAQPQYAAIIHLPLGILGFAVAGAAMLFGMRRWGTIAPSASAQPAAERVLLPSYHWLAVAGLAVLLAMVFYRPAVRTGLQTQTRIWQLPPALSAQPQPLTTSEYFWLTRDGADAAQRWQWQQASYQGSLLLISSHTWRAHHKPERCFEVQGYQLGVSETWLLQPDFAVQRIPINVQAQAIYWFQSAEQSTADYSTRLWDDLRWQPNEWVLVALVTPAQMPKVALSALLDQLRLNLAAQLTNKN